MHLSPPISYSNKASRNHVLSSFLNPAIRPIAFAKAWLLPMLPSSTEISLDTLKGCGKCLDYNLSRIWKWKGRSWGKTIMDCVENYGYNNLSFSRIVARVFALRSTPQHIWVMWVYIVWIETGCIKYDKIAKQNVLWVFCGKASPARHSRKLAVTILSWLFAFQLYVRHMLHFAGRLLTSYPRNLLFFALCLKSSHSLFHTHNPYKQVPHKIHDT